MSIFNRHNRQPKHEILPGDSDLVKRLKKYGSKGIIVVHSPEGAPISPEAAKWLRPAGSDIVEEQTDSTS